MTTATATMTIASITKMLKQHKTAMLTIGSAIGIMMGSTLTVMSTAHAELVMESVDTINGKTNVVIKDNKQEGPPPAQLGISPSQVVADLPLRVGKLDKSFTFYNYADYTKQMSLRFIDVDKDGKPLAESGDTLAQLRPWVLMNPISFDIEPKGYQTVRFSIRPPQDLPKQTYRAVLLIEEDTSKLPTTDGSGESVSMRIGSNYAMPIVIEVK